MTCALNRPSPLFVIYEGFLGGKIYWEEEEVQLKNCSNSGRARRTPAPAGGAPDIAGGARWPQRAHVENTQSAKSHSRVPRSGTFCAL